MILYLFGGNSKLYEYEFEKCCRKLMEMRIPFRSKIMNRYVMVRMKMVLVSIVVV